MSELEDSSLVDWMEDANIELKAKPLERPKIKEPTPILTQVYQVKPTLVDGDIRFATHTTTKPIAMAIERFDEEKGRTVYDYQAHTLASDNTGDFHVDGPFFCDIPPGNSMGLRTVKQAKRITSDRIIFGDEHASGDYRFSDGAVEEVHPTLADALGCLRSEALIGYKKQYRPTFREIDRYAVNLLAALYGAIRFNMHEDPHDVAQKIEQATSSWNIQYLLSRELAAAWQKRSAQQLQLRTNDLAASEEATNGTTGRFSRELHRFRDDLNKLFRDPENKLYCIDEVKLRDEKTLEEQLQRSYRVLMPLFELTHPMSSVISSLLYNPQGKMTATGKTLRQYHATLRTLVRYFSNEKDPHTGNSFLDAYREYWGQFESQARALTIQQFIDAGSWKPLYQRGKSLTIGTPDLEATLQAAHDKGYELKFPVPLGPGRYARFKDDQGNIVGLWSPKRSA